MGLSGILLPHSLPAVRKRSRRHQDWGWRHLPSSTLCRTQEQRRSSACPDALMTPMRCSPREYLHSRRKGMQPWQFPAAANVTSLGTQTAARRPDPPCRLKRSPKAGWEGGSRTLHILSESRCVAATEGLWVVSRTKLHPSMKAESKHSYLGGRSLRGPIGIKYSAVFPCSTSPPPKMHILLSAKQLLPCV